MVFGGDYGGDNDIYWQKTISNNSWTFHLKDIMIDNRSHDLESLEAIIDTDIANI